MNTTKVIAIPIESKREFDNNIESLKRLAKKLGKQEPIITVSDVYQYTKINKNLIENTTYEYILDVFDCTIELEQTLKLDGNWSIIGKVDYNLDYIYMIDADREIPNNYSTKNHSCEHCNTNHKKAKSFILENVNTKEIKQVGSSCLHKFLSVRPESYISMLSALKENNDIIASYKNRIPKQSHKAVSLDLIWSLTFDQVQEDGEYIKSLYYDDDNCKSYNRVRSNYGYATHEKVSRKLDTAVEGNINLEICIKIREYLNTIKPKIISVYQENDEDGNEIYADEDFTSGYHKSIMIFKDAKNCKMMDLPLVVSIYNSYLGYLKELARIESVKGFEYVGVVGEKIPVKLQIKMIKFIANEWGGSNLYKMEDEKGNKYTKFGTISAKFLTEGENVEEGSNIECLAEVKNHEEYRNEKQTVLGRLSKIKK